jgi:all-trans-8'-apo-beta-carotenal 15,15'-oxygenase
VRGDWSWNLQLSAMDWCTEGMAKPTLHHLAYHGCRPGAIARRALDFYADRIDESAIPTEDTPGVLVTFERGSLDEKSRWEYKDTSDFITSPTFAPRRASSGGYAGPNPGGHDGYVILPVQNDRGFRVEVFDAAKVGAGPIAVASAPAGRTVPALLHAAWMPRVVSAVDAERMSFASELDDTVLATLDDDVVTVTREIADELAG